MIFFISYLLCKHFFPYHVCKQFILSFRDATYNFSSPPPPLQKNNGPSLTRQFKDHVKLVPDPVKMKASLSKPQFAQTIQVLSQTFRLKMCPLSYRMGGVLGSLSTLSQGVGEGHRANELKLKGFVWISPQLTALVSKPYENATFISTQTKTKHLII